MMLPTVQQIDEVRRLLHIAKQEFGRNTVATQSTDGWCKQNSAIRATLEQSLAACGARIRCAGDATWLTLWGISASSTGDLVAATGAWITKASKKAATL